MDIRKAKLGDVEEVSRLQSLMSDYHLRFDDYWKTKKEAREMWIEYAKKEIKSPNAAIFVAVDDDEIVGYVLGKIKERPPIFKINKIGYIDDAFVLKDQRRKGIGEKLVESMLDWFKSKGIEYSEIEVDARNKIGIRAWSKYKFKTYVLKMKRKI